MTIKCLYMLIYQWFRQEIAHFLNFVMWHLQILLLPMMPLLASNLAILLFNKMHLSNLIRNSIFMGVYLINLCFVFNTMQWPC